MRSANVIGKPILCVFMALVIAIAPLNVKFEGGFSIEQNEAQAIAPVFAGAAAFLGEVAAAAGLTTGELVATVAGMTAIGTGMSIATSAGVRYGTEASQNLNNLVDAADYPAWDTLSSSEKESWGSQDNYDSAKFNSLMAAYGLGDAYGRYQSAWGSGGAGNFSFSSQEQSSLDQIGDIGSNWINGLPNTIDDITSMFSNDSQTVINNYFGVTSYEQVNTDNMSDYPNSKLANPYINKGNHLIIEWSTGKFTEAVTSSEVYFWISKNTSNYVIGLSMFSDQGFTYKVRNYVTASTMETPLVPETTALQRTFDNNVFYSSTGSTYAPTGTVKGYSSNMYVNTHEDLQNSGTDMYNCVPYLLFSNQLDSIGSLDPNVVDYPGETNIDNSVNLYFPSGGLNDDTPWEDFLTYQEEITEDLSGIITLLRHIDTDLHNFEFTSLGNLKVYDGVVADILDNTYQRIVNIETLLGKLTMPSNADQIIGNFDFDDIEAKVPDLLETISELAPFGALALLSEIFAIVSEVNVVDSPELVFPFQFGGYTDDGLELVVDLSWMDDLKPAINFFTILMLVLGLTYATIRVVQMEAAP